MELIQPFVYTGTPISFVTQEHFVYNAGNGIAVWNLETKQKEFIWHNSFGFSKVVANYRNNLIAATENTYSPAVIIFTFPDKEPQMTLNQGSELFFKDLQFNRDGNWLLTLNSSHELTVWDVYEGQQVQGLQKIQIEGAFKATFDPYTGMSIAVMNRNSVELVKIHKSFSIEAGQLKEVYRHTFQNFSVKGQDYTLKDMIWDKYKNLLISTDTTKLLIVESENMQLLQVVETEYIIKSMVLTHRYLILMTSEGQLEWIHVFIPNGVNDPRMVKGKPSPSLQRAKYMQLSEEEEHNAWLQSEVFMTYNPQHMKIILTSETGKIMVIPQEAEPDFDEEDEEEQEESQHFEEGQELGKSILQLDTEWVMLGNYHTKPITATQPLGDTTQFASISLDGSLKIWELTDGEFISQIENKDCFTSLNSNNSGTLILAGSSGGCVRIFNVIHRDIPRLLQIYKFFQGMPVSFAEFSPNQDLIAVASNDTYSIWFLEGSQESNWRVIGHVQIDYQVRKCIWALNSSGEQVLLALVGDELLAEITTPDTKTPSILTPLDDIQVLYKHIHPGTTCLATVPTLQNKVILSGKDKTIRIVAWPNQLIQDIDLRKLPPNPLEEYKGHEIQVSVLQGSNEFLASGSIDGVIQIRKVSELGKSNFIAMHSSKNLGVTDIKFTQDCTIIYTSGGDSSMFAYSLDGEVPYKKGVDEDLEIELEPLEDLPDAQMQYYITLKENEQRAIEAPMIEATKEQLRAEVLALKEKLQGLIKLNNNSLEIEQLQREEFVLDIEKEKQLLREAEEAAMKEKEKCKKELLTWKLLKQRIQNKTWDSMETQQKYIQGMKSDIKVHNFSIRKFTAQEQKEMQRAILIRNIELSERAGQEPHFNYSKNPETYIINRGNYLEPKGQQWDPLKDKDKEKEKEQEQKQSKQLAQQQQAQQQEEQHYSKIRTKTMNMLYEPYELFTNNRRRLQINLLKLIIREQKESFNNDFKTFENLKSNALAQLEEKNDRIKELQKELQLKQSVFTVEEEFNPNDILKVNENEIKSEKYLTKEQRLALEEAKKKEEERIRLLNQDDSGKRALQQMMGGTLEVKKDVGAMQSELIREEWMDKLTLEEMTEEQRIKLKEFDEKVKKMQEEAEKLKKANENELKKLDAFVQEQIITKFDQKLNELFKRRLTVNYEIYTQEIYIQRLNAWTLKEAQLQKKVNAVEVKIAECQVEKKEEEIKSLQAQHTAITAKIKNLEAEGKQLDDYWTNKIKRNIQDTDVTTNLQRLYKRARQVKKPQQILPKELEDTLFILNPFVGFDRETYIQQLGPPPLEKLDYEEYPNIAQNHWEKLIAERERRYEIDNEIEKQTKLQKNLSDHITYLEKVKADIKKQLQLLSQDHDQLLQKKEDEKHNLEILIELKQSILEVPQKLFVTDYTDAMLVPRETIEIRNSQILEIGNQKVKTLQDICKYRVGVNRKNWEENLLKKQAEHLRKCVGDVKVLRSDKTTQNILIGKGLDQHRIEQEKLTKQMEKMKDNTEQRVAAKNKNLKKIKQQIENYMRENKNLENEVHEMQEKRNQRLQIKQLKKGGKEAQKQEPMYKFKQASMRRRLLNLARSQTEEIEFLRDELDRLRGRTFPSFAHVHNRIDFPDEV